MRLLKIIIPCLLLSACILGKSQNAKFYTQSATAAGVISAGYKGFIGINRVQLPKYIDRPQMVTQNKDSAQINVSEYNRWVEAPSVLTLRVLTENLSTLLPAAQIKANQFKGENFDWTVSVEIMKMDALLGEKAELTAWYTIRNNSKNIQVQQKFAGTLAIGKTYDDLAKGYSELLAQLSADIAQTLISR